MSKTINSDSVRRLAELLDETGLTEIEYDTGAVKIRVARQPGVVAAMVPAAAPPAAAAVPASPVVEPEVAITADHPGAVTSPMVGTVYLAPEPAAAAFINIGDAVSRAYEGSLEYRYVRHEHVLRVRWRR